MPAKEVTNSTLADLIASGQQTSKEWREDMRADIDAKHKENIDRRHALMGKVEMVENRVHAVDGRVGALEMQMISIVGDNSGGSGLLHKMDKALDMLKEEVASIKQTVQNTPAINRWIYGAMGIIGFLIIVVPSVLFVVFELLKMVYLKH